MFRRLSSLTLEIFLLILLPYYLMTTQVSVLAARPLIMGFGGLYCTLMLFYHRVKLPTLGLTRNNFGPGIKSLVVPSLLVIIGIYFVLQYVTQTTRIWLIGSDPLTISNFYARLAFYVFGSAPVQELIFRGYLTWRLEKAELSQFWLWILSVGIFTLLHAPFKSPIMLGVALVLGIIYLANFLRYRNLLAVSVSHGLVGAVLIILRNYYLPY